MSAAQITLDAVSLQLGAQQALKGVSLRIAAGERVALVGANGSGKSSLLRTLHGLVPPTQGQVIQTPGVRQAMLFQRPHMLRLSALNNVALGVWLDRSRALNWRASKALALQALQRVGLQSVAQQNGRQLSGGQQQRLALARAWARQPDVLLLDEPTASLDPHAKREVEALMAEFASGPVPDKPLTLVWASHNLGQVKRLATRVIYLEFGRVLADLPVADFSTPICWLRTARQPMLLFKVNFHDLSNFHPPRPGVRRFGHHLGLGASPVDCDVVHHLHRAVGLVRTLAARFQKSQWVGRESGGAGHGPGPGHGASR